MPQTTPEAFEVLAEALARKASPADILTAMSPEAGLSRPIRRVLESDAVISIKAAESGWVYPSGQFKVVVTPTVPLHYEVILPPYYASLELTEEHVARTRHPSVFDTIRLADMIALTLDALTRNEAALVPRMAAAVGREARFQFLVSMEDHCGDGVAVALSRLKGNSNPMIADTYSFNSDAYLRHKLNALKRLDLWQQRSDTIVWRGSTTGSAYSAADLLRNERIRMAAVCSARPDLFDVKITGIVQAPAGEEQLVRDQLEAQGLLTAWRPMTDLVDSKFALHIDGNASAAGYMEKLSLGCCVLRVESRFEQWFEDRLQPWEHFVPIAADLSNLVKTAEFLRRTPLLAERIGRAALQFALDCDPESESRRFIALITRPVVHELLLDAPSASEGVDPSWHGVEDLPDGRQFRWTGSNRVRWPIGDRLTGPGRVEVMIPLTGEITSGFAQRSAIVFDGVQHPVSYEGGYLKAAFFVDGSELDDALSLITPDPIAPCDLGPSSDVRPLGLAVQVL